MTGPKSQLSQIDVSSELLLASVICAAAVILYTAVPNLKCCFDLSKPAVVFFTTVAVLLSTILSHSRKSSCICHWYCCITYDLTQHCRPPPATGVLIWYSCCCSGVLHHNSQKHVGGAEAVRAGSKDEGEEDSQEDLCCTVSPLDPEAPGIDLPCPWPHQGNIYR